LEGRAVDVSLRFGVLCRFTAYVAVDSRVVTEGGRPHRVVQPVEPASGWDMLAAPTPARPVVAGGMRMMAMRLDSGSAAPPPNAAAAHTRPAWGATGGLLGAVTTAVSGMAGAGAAAGARAQLRSVREVAAVEARRLRESAGLPGYERWELLADLASRLTALVGHLASLGTPEPGYSSLRRLVTALGAGGDLETLWAEAMRVLDAFAAADAPVTEETEETDRRRTFWKRT
jgi:Ca-activated chloride channel family protein